MALDRVKLPNGETVVFDEWLHWPLFSTIEWAAASPVNLRAFTYVVGQKIPSKGINPKTTANPSHTNQVSKSRMNWDESFRIFSMTYEVFGKSDATITGSPNILAAESPMVSALNLRRLQRDLIVELLVGVEIKKGQVRAPFSYFHQGVGPVMYGSGDAPDANQGISAGTGGDVAWASQRRYAFPVVIESDKNMQLRVYSSPNGAVAGLDQDIQMRWYLDGVKRRPLG